MKTPAYILGALDALVKAGAVSPDYAAGAASVLVKDAGLWWDSAAQNMHDNYREWRKKNPYAEMNPEIARDMALRSRNWYSRAFSPNAGWGNWFSNRFDKWTNGIRKFFGGGKPKMTDEMYDRELRDMENQELDQYASEHFSENPEVAGALQDGFVRDADFRVLDAKNTMSNLDRVEAGLTDDYADQYRNRAGTSAISSGAYKAKYDKKSMGPKPPDEPYGKKLPQEYGANKKLFYRVGYSNPLG